MSMLNKTIKNTKSYASMASTSQQRVIKSNFIQCRKGYKSSNHIKRNSNNIRLQSIHGLGTSTFCPGNYNLKYQTNCKRIKRKLKACEINARVRDPDAISDDDENPNKYPPNGFWRAMSAFMYIIPWLDTVGLGREIYHRFPMLIYLYTATAPFVGIYYCSQFAPLVIFFLMFLAIVKNEKLAHFVRFNCMQAVMLDIVVMLFTIIHSYFPAEIRWSVLLGFFDMFAWTSCMSTIIYCIFFTLKGYYADVPYVSEAVYIQVELSEYA